MTSAISRFYRLTMPERRERIADAAGVDVEDLAKLVPADGLGEREADRMVENALGVFGLPLGVCVNMMVNERDVLIPMVTEEPSVIAACSYAAKLLRAGGGVTAKTSRPIVEGQIQLLEVADPEAATKAVLGAKDELIELANSKHPRLVGAGGGARSLRVRRLPRVEADDPCGDMLIVHLAVDVQDAMGANAINSMCERLAPRIAELTGGRVALRILTNLSDQRTVTVTGRVPFSLLDGKGGVGGEELARRIEEASVFAERDPYRACTHNKGIMNGVDAALIALGQDWRAVEAGAHAYAAKDGRYTAMARWRVEDGHLVGRMTLPLAVGTVGGVAGTHPLVGINRRIAKIEHADQLAGICAAAGIAQNLGALRALAAEGIQRGHMRLHARNVAVEAGAGEDEVLEVARRIADAGAVNAREAEKVIAQLRSTPPPAIAAVADARRQRPPTPPSPIVHEALGVEDERDEINPEQTSLTGKVLVTGAAGLLGSNLVRRLLDEGIEVRALVREGSDNSALDGLGVERVSGDLRDASRMATVVRGCDHVFHVAAMVSTAEPTPAIEREIYESNVLGTRNLLSAAREAGVQRVVVTGSFDAVGHDLDDPQAPGHEGLPHWPFEEVSPDVRSKVLVEHEALKACVEGLDVVIATSCAIVGPNDHKPSQMGRSLCDFAHGKMAAYVSGGFDLVSARDIADGHILAMRRGRRGQKYILSTEYLEVDELMGIFEEVSGAPRPRRVPGAVMTPVAEVSSFVSTFFPSASQRLSPASVRRLGKRRRADTSKAQRELGFRPSSVRDAVHAAYADFARRGLVPARRGTTAAPVISDGRERESDSRRATGS